MNIPYSIDHVDLHPGNAVRLDNGRILIYDWEEAVVSCPFFSTDKLLDEAFKLDNRDGSTGDGLWSVSQMAVKEAYISKMKCLTFSERSEAFDIAMCIAPVKYAYQGTFFIEQVGWFESAPVLIGESIVKVHERCSKIPFDF
jgi:thiamine kinase-like enzyme